METPRDGIPKTRRGEPFTFRGQRGPSSQRRGSKTLDICAFAWSPQQLRRARCWEAAAARWGAGAMCSSSSNVSVLSLTLTWSSVAVRSLSSAHRLSTLSFLLLLAFFPFFSSCCIHCWLSRFPFVPTRRGLSLPGYWQRHTRLTHYALALWFSLSLSKSPPLIPPFPLKCPAEWIGASFPFSPFCFASFFLPSQLQVSSRVPLPVFPR